MTDAQNQIIDLLGDIHAAQSPGGAASFASLTGNPSDNTALGSALDAKQTEAEVQALIAGEVGVTIARGGYALIVSESDTTVLTAASKRIQRVTGTEVQDVQFPVTSTLYLGYDFLFINRSTQPITLKSSGGNTILVVPGGAMAQAVCVALTGTTASSWIAEQISDFAALDSPAFINNPTAPTQSAGDNSTKLATTSYVATEIATNVGAATYSPGTSAEVNLDTPPTASLAQYLRVGTVVTVSGSVAIDITATGTPTSFRLTLPPGLTSNFTDEDQAGGTASSSSVAGQAVAIKARNGGDVLFEWVSVGTAAQTLYYSFTYQIIP